ncbi:receptor [Nesidiocoris tenuis]|uniref:Receptor n=2 Tax=Nesidiocoris tenuis TaxID=355587 RepID=A0ABN7B7K5_9HEMI|nr:receptor [Nesidiocoris tenuis]
MKKTQAFLSVFSKPDFQYESAIPALVQIHPLRRLLGKLVENPRRTRSVLLEPPSRMDATPSTCWSCYNDTDINSFYFYETEQFAILWLLFILIVFGNSAVLAALQCGKKPKSRMNFFIMQLAVADLCVGVLSVLTDIVWRSTVAWNAGNTACKVIRFSQAVVTFSSTYVLVALSIDRYYAIKYPMNFSGSWRRAKMLVVIAWSLSVVLSVPVGFLYQEKLIQGRPQCWIEFRQPWQWQLYMTLVAMALFVLPAIIITICYAIIVFTIWAKGRQYTQKATNNDETRRASSRGIIPQAKVKTVKMTFIIVLVFVLCWSPYIVFDLLQVYGHIPRTQTNIAVASLIQSLAPLNSAANPLIYCLFSSQKNR